MQQHQYGKCKNISMLPRYQYAHQSCMLHLVKNWLSNWRLKRRPKFPNRPDLTYLQYFQIFWPQLVVKIGNVRWYGPPSFLHPVTVCPTSTHWAVPVKCVCSTVYKLQTNSKFRSCWTILSIIMGHHTSLILLVTSFVDFVSLTSWIQ